jgi:succinate-semialdehyde dehydrogenase/glutarate-semialdehyde dehydrogenase
LVQRSVHADFVKALLAQTQKLKVGNGLEEGTTLGPLANERRLLAMNKIVGDAKQRGAEVVTGGARIGETGYFFAPTILNDVPLDADVFNNEPFGPIAAVRAVDTLDEAINEANRLQYGLAGYAFTRSLHNAHQLAQRLEVGMLWINSPATPSAEMPFGGVKDSGYGTEGGPEALEAYLVSKSVSIMTG